MDWLDLLAVQGTLKSSPTPQFKSINSSMLSLLHSPTLTYIHDHRKNHSLDYTVKGFSIVNKAEVNVFLELSCFFHDPVDVGNLISGSSASSKSSLNIWKFMVYVLLKPGLENFEHYFTSMWDEYNGVVVWAFFCIAFLWNWNENWPFQSCGHCWVFQICWHIEYSTFTGSSSKFEITQLEFHHLH